MSCSDRFPLCLKNLWVMRLGLTTAPISWDLGVTQFRKRKGTKKRKRPSIAVSPNEHTLYDLTLAEHVDVVSELEWWFAVEPLTTVIILTEFYAPRGSPLQPPVIGTKPPTLIVTIEPHARVSVCGPLYTYKGVIERSDPINLIHVDDMWVEHPCTGFARAARKLLDRYMSRPVGSMAHSSVNPVGQALNTMYRRRGRLYPIHACDDCGGLLKYEPHNEIVCQACGLVHENIVTTEFMNGSWSDEQSGDDDAWRVKELAAADESEDHGDDGIRTNNRQTRKWRESGNYQAQGVRLKGIKPRNLNANDIKLREIGRVCRDLGCNITQLKNNTNLQHKFVDRFEELYQVRLFHQALAAKIDFFETNSR
jgi:hypothetical protein